MMSISKVLGHYKPSEQRQCIDSTSLWNYTGGKMKNVLPSVDFSSVDVSIMMVVESAV